MNVVLVLMDRSTAQQISVQQVCYNTNIIFLLYSVLLTSVTMLQYNDIKTQSTPVRLL